MEKTFKTMKKLFCLATIVGVSSVSFSDEIEQRVSDLELKSLLNKIRIQGELDNYFDSYRTKNIEDIRIDHVGNKLSTNLNAFRLRAALDFSADITDHVHVYTTLAVKNHYTLTNVDTSASTLLNGNHPDYNSNFAILEKAYIDVGFESVPLVFSIGRLPTFGGPPTNIRDGMPRQSTYPILAYSFNLDGVAATFNLKQYLGEDLSLRLVYTPLSDTFQSAPYIRTQGEKYGDHPTPNVLAQMLEYTNQNIPALEKLTFILQNNIVNYRGFPDFSMDGVTYQSDKEMLKAYTTTGYLEFENLAKIGLTAYTQLSFVNVQNKGDVYMKTQAGTMKLGGLISNSGSKRGNSQIYGLRYELPYSLKTQIGGEFARGSRYTFTPGFVDEQLIGFYKNLRGRGYHGYINQPIWGNSNIRVGLYHIDRDYREVFIGDPAPSSAKISDLYVAFKVRY